MNFRPGTHGRRIISGAQGVGAILCGDRSIAASWRGTVAARWAPSLLFTHNPTIPTQAFASLVGHIAKGDENCSALASHGCSAEQSPSDHGSTITAPKLVHVGPPGNLFVGAQWDPTLPLDDLRRVNGDPARGDVVQLEQVRRPAWARS